MPVDGRELVPHDWEADAEQGGNVLVLFPGVAPPRRDCADAGCRLKPHWAENLQAQRVGEVRDAVLL
jgi:hypothetical protein